eukprot:TRINITY_DN915_c0_g1_i4.p1 TRINITY_DN915_c0_g1~~TRINITY_DN915_c0_g1_i4.p1  ORF type:complete len:221 (-),score=20.07 TRINITY_DN915_c0_g1_i4:201-863(-)
MISTIKDEDRYYIEIEGEGLESATKEMRRESQKLWEIFTFLQRFGADSNEPDCVIDGLLYLGDSVSVNNFEFQRQHNIKYIISLCNSPKDLPKSKRDYPHDYEFLGFEATDLDSYNISQHFEECFEFIERAKSEKKAVLIHCLQGVSRSSTICCAYLMKERGLTTLKSLQFLKQKRPCIVPNCGFMLRLLIFEQKLKEQKLQEQKLKLLGGESSSSAGLS